MRGVTNIKYQIDLIECEESKVGADDIKFEEMQIMNEENVNELSTFHDESVT